ncbi:SAG family member [Eimeria brunetti]|uniref:SAG family member n=1 Tax=Eimeria brunetti TaxID=51314 RepID=U6L8T1_9EIME|nr:SAG family member [Eimeria brunetti]
MAPLHQIAAAVCLVAFSGLKPASAASQVYKFEAVQVDDAAYLAANLARNGKLPVHIEEVTKDEGLVSSVQKTVTTTETTVPQGREAIDKESCEALIKASTLKDIFHYTFEYKESPNYRELLQAALEAGLKVFDNNKYPSDWKTVWANDAGGSLAYLLWSKSTNIGCVIGKCTKTAASADGMGDSKQRDDSGRISSEATQTTPAVLFCQLDPAPTKDQAPFDEEYFTGLITRTAKLADMTADDLKAPTNDAAAAAALPPILSAGLIAMLAAVSV